MWNYRCHKLLNGLLRWPIKVCHFVLNLSWDYAHYRNGKGPRLEMSFSESVRDAWEEAERD